MTMDMSDEDKKTLDQSSEQNFFDGEGPSQAELAARANANKEHLKRSWEIGQQNLQKKEQQSNPNPPEATEPGTAPQESEEYQEEKVPTFQEWQARLRRK